MDERYPAFATGELDGGESLVRAEQFIDALEIGMDRLRRLAQPVGQHLIVQAAGFGAGSQQFQQGVGQGTLIGTDRRAYHLRSPQNKCFDSNHGNEQHSTAFGVTQLSSSFARQAGEKGVGGEQRANHRKLQERHT